MGAEPPVLAAAKTAAYLSNHPFKTAGSQIFATVVTYNRLQDLRICIESLRQQTRPFDRLIVINNDSTDGTSEWLSYQMDITTITQPNLGSGGGSFLALKEALNAGADLIYLLDDDCVASRDALASLLEARKGLSNPEEWVLTSLATDPKSGQIGPITLVEKGIPTAPKKMITSLRDLPEDALNGGIIQNWGHFFIGTLIPSAIVQMIGYPNPNYFIRGEDYEYLLRCIRSHRVGIAVKSIMLHPMEVVSRPKAHSHIDWKEYCQLRNHMAINREYFPSLRNSPPLRILKYASRLLGDLISGRGVDRLLYLAYYDAISGNLRREIPPLMTRK